MTDDTRRRTRRREVIVLAGLLAGMASAALVAQMVEPRVAAGRVAG